MRRKNIYIVASNMFSTCYVNSRYNSTLKLSWYNLFSYTDFCCSQNGLDTMKISFICNDKCCFNHLCASLD